MRIFVATMSLATLGLLAYAPMVRAQDVAPSDQALETRPADDRSVVFSVGVGAGSLDLVGSAAISFDIGDALDLTVRATETSAFNLFSPSDLARDVAVLVGKRAASGTSWVRVAAGLAWTHSLDYGQGYNCYWFSCDYDEREEDSIGLALQGDAVLAVWRSFGVGLTAFGNLNPVRSFAGLTLGLHFGRQR